MMTVLDENGRELRTERILNRRSHAQRFLAPYRPFTAVLEAGRASYVMADLLRELGGQVKLANPLQVKAIAHARIKTDKRDSRTLAQLLRADLIPEVYQRGEWNRRAQRVMRLRAYWVSKQTEVRNKIRALLAQQREEIRLEVEKREAGLFRPNGLEFLGQLALEAPDKLILEDLVQGHRQIQAHVKLTDGLVKTLYDEMEEAARIDTIPGFARTLSVLVAVEIADIRRFPRLADLHSYAGVIPSTRASGSRTFHGHLTKQGSVWLRWAVVEAVYPAIRRDLVLRALYKRLARRKGANVAKIAVARRLLTIIYRVLSEKRDYIPGFMKRSAA
jgi:transposase